MVSWFAEKSSSENRDVKKADVEIKHTGQQLEEKTDSFIESSVFSITPAGKN